MVSEEIKSIIQSVIGTGSVELHEPWLNAKEVESVVDCIGTSYVSTFGKSINYFEELLSEITGVNHVVAVVNGTSALHLGLIGAGVRAGDEVLVPALTFVGSANAICHAGATPHFLDSNINNLGIDVKKLEEYLAQNTKIVEDSCYNLISGRRISAIMPVHIFGHIGHITELCEIAKKYRLNVVEDAAEALGSYKGNKHAGSFGLCGILSFNGNKIITTGGGGAILTNDESVANRLRHLSQNSKIPHDFEYWHDSIGYNYRMPSLNASLGIAQLEKLPQFLLRKKELAKAYKAAFRESKASKFYEGPSDSLSNNWLNTILLNEEFIQFRNVTLSDLKSYGITCRPVWTLLSDLPHFSSCPSMEIKASKKIASRIINIPSSAFLIGKKNG